MKLQILGCALAAFTMSACGGSDDNDSPAPAKPEPTATPSPDDSDESEGDGPTLIQNGNNLVTVQLQESTGEVVKETAAISCSYSGFGDWTYGEDSTYALSEPDRVTCAYGYKKSAGDQRDVPTYKIPSALVGKKPEFPADLVIYSLKNVGTQNTTAIRTTLPRLSLINTQNCHTAEVRFQSNGKWKNYSMKANAVEGFFDLQSTDFANEFSRYIADTRSGNQRQTTKREPVDVVYLCTWHAPRVLENDYIVSVDEKVEDRSGHKALWNLTIRDDEGKVAELKAASSEELYQTLNKTEFISYTDYTAFLTVLSPEGKLLATNDPSVPMTDEEKSKWDAECASTPTELTVDFDGTQTRVAVGLCDLVGGFLDTGVKTQVMAENKTPTEFWAPIRCSFTNMERDGNDTLRISSRSRQSCDFSFPESNLVLPAGTHNLGYLEGWDVGDAVFSARYGDVKFDGFRSDKVALKLANVNEFNHFSRYHCDAAAAGYVDQEGQRHFLKFDGLEGTSLGKYMNYTRTTDMEVSEEESFSAGLRSVSSHLDNTADFNFKVDVYLLCKWWAKDGETVVGF